MRIRTGIWILFAIFAAFLYGCKGPEVDSDTLKALSPPAGPGPEAGQAQAGPGAAGGAAQQVIQGPPPGDKGPEVIKPKHTQEDLKKSGKYLTVTGEVKCKECQASEPIIIDVLAPPTKGPYPELVTRATLEKAGPFELLVPADVKELRFSAIADTDKNGMPSMGEAFGEAQGGKAYTVTSAGLKNVSIEVKKSPMDALASPTPQPPPEAAGQPGQPAATPPAAGEEKPKTP